MNNQTQLKKLMSDYAITPSELASKEYLDVANITVRKWLCNPETKGYSGIRDRDLVFLELLIKSKLA